MLRVVEIINEAQQGITKPFLCRCDDDQEYYVKRANAGRKALIAEWVAGSLARKLMLPVPLFDLAEIPEELLAIRSREERRDWGAGPVFASRVVDNAVELRFTNVRSIPLRQQAEILLFDCWIGNADRTLSQLGGNPNLLWSDQTQQVSMIDHNLAFESPTTEVRADHVFAAATTAWDHVFVSDWTQRLVAAASTLPDIWGKLPDVWIEESAGLITLETVKERLRLFTSASDTAWNT
jgi:hypothetical protein